MKKWMLVLLAVFVFFPFTREAGAADRKKKGKQTEIKAPVKKSAYDKRRICRIYAESDFVKSKNTKSDTKERER